jgi:hypothetical protein
MTSIEVAYITIRDSALLDGEGDGDGAVLCVLETPLGDDLLRDCLDPCLADDPRLFEAYVLDA